MEPLRPMSNMSRRSINNLLGIIRNFPVLIVLCVLLSFSGFLSYSFYAAKCLWAMRETADRGGLWVKQSGTLESVDFKVRGRWSSSKKALLQYSYRLKSAEYTGSRYTLYDRFVSGEKLGEYLAMLQSGVESTREVDVFVNTSDPRQSVLVLEPIANLKNRFNKNAVIALSALCVFALGLFVSFPFRVRDEVV